MVDSASRYANSKRPNWLLDGTGIVVSVSIRQFKAAKWLLDGTDIMDEDTPIQRGRIGYLRGQAW